MNDQRFEHHRPLALITDEAQTDPTECFFPEWKTVDENVNQIIYTIVDRGIVQCFLFCVKEHVVLRTNIHRESGGF